MHTYKLTLRIDDTIVANAVRIWLSATCDFLMPGDGRTHDECLQYPINSLTPSGIRRESV